MQDIITPLHLAAQYGHFDICKHICDNTNLQGRQNKKHDYFLRTKVFKYHHDLRNRAN